MLGLVGAYLIWVGVAFTVMAIGIYFCGNDGEG